MKKRTMMLVMSITLLVLLIAGGTFAWFTAQADPVVNNFKAGTLEFEANEFFCEPLAQNVNPGDCYPKLAFFHNTGTKRMFVRVKITPDFPNMTNPDTDIVNYDILPGWKDGGDGYYYYLFPVPSGWYSGPVIKKVCFDGEEMDNTYQGEEFTLTIESEAIQVTNDAALTEWGIYPPSLLFGFRMADPTSETAPELDAELLELIEILEARQ